MLVGEYNCALDDKGRLNFPAKLREEMGESFWITRWLDGCLVAFPGSEWEKMAAIFEEKSMVKSRRLKRQMYSGAGEVKPDKQGRVLIPPPLRSAISLGKDAVVIGVGRYAEIWDAEAWADESGSFDSNSMEAAMEELGF